MENQVMVAPASNKNYAMSRPALIILVTSLVLSVVFVIIGAVLIVSSGGGSEQAPPASTGVAISYNVPKTVSCSSGDQLFFRFTATSSGYHQISVNGGEIEDVTNWEKDPNMTAVPGTYYDDCVSVYLTMGSSYVIEVGATGGSVMIKIS